MEPRPVDLYLRTSAIQELGQRFLSYELSSPSERVEIRRKARSEPVPVNISDLSRQFYSELEDLLAGIGVEQTPMSSRDIEERLRGMGKSLYRRLLPGVVREVFDETLPFEDLSLLVESDEPWFPWEILHTYGSQGDFFCLRYRMGRWISKASFAGRLPEKSFEVSRFLAIDAGKLSLWNRRSPAALPDSAREVALLQGRVGLDGVLLDDPRYDLVLEKLKEGGFQWFHFVGHGDFPEDETADLASLVLEQQNLYARDLVDDVEKALSRERPFVFLNACRTARQGPSFTGLGGWPTALIEICGCGGLLAPRCAVSNRQAMSFASNFYDRLDEGLPLGEAIRRARVTIRTKDESSSTGPLGVTALAYVYYGHPNAMAYLGLPPPQSGEGEAKDHGTESLPEAGDRVVVRQETKVPGLRPIPNETPPRELLPASRRLLTPRRLRLLVVGILVGLPVFLFLLGAASQHARETMLGISHQDYPADELLTNGIQAMDGFFVNGLSAVLSPHPELRTSAWFLLALSALCPLVSRLRPRRPAVESIALLSATLALGLGVLHYTFALRALHPEDNPDPTGSLCSATYRNTSEVSVTREERIVVESCTWLSYASSTHEARRQALGGLFPLFLLAGFSTLGCGFWWMALSGWRKPLPWILVGLHGVVLVLVLRQMPLAHSYSYWGLEYPRVEIERSCGGNLGESLAAGNCCAYDVSAGAEKTVLLVRGEQCQKVGVVVWDTAQCSLTRLAEEAIPQGCAF